MDCISLALFTAYGISCTIMQFLPFISSMLVSARSVILPRPVPYARPAHDYSAGREVRAFYALHQLVKRAVRVAHHQLHSVYYFAQVVRGYVRRHAYGYAYRTVAEQLRKTRGQYYRLFKSVVVVRLVVYRLFAYVGEHIHRNFRHLCFRVSVSRRRVAVYRAEVSLSVYHRVSQRECLRHSYQRVVYRSVAVRVIFTQHRTYRVRALSVRLLGV